LRLVNFGSKAARLDDEKMDRLKKDLLVKAFSVSNKVEILQGIFKCMEAIFNVYKGEKRVMVLLNFMAKKSYR